MKICVLISLILFLNFIKDEVAAFEAKKKEFEAKGQKMDSNSIVRPRIKLSSCLEMFNQPEIVEQFYSTALNEKTNARKCVEFFSFYCS